MWKFLPAFWITFPGVYYVVQSIWAFWSPKTIFPVTFLIICDSLRCPHQCRGHLSSPSRTWTLGFPVQLTESADLYHISCRDDNVSPTVECHSVKCSNLISPGVIVLLFLYFFLKKANFAINVQLICMYIKEIYITGVWKVHTSHLYKETENVCMKNYTLAL